MKIAIIGAGISGLTTAYLLHRHHDVRVFERNRCVGGHTATVDVHVAGRSYPVDTGFIVFNDWTYPRFTRLLDTLGVAAEDSQMGFSVTCRGVAGREFEYRGSGLNGLFADRGNLVRADFYRMLYDIARFNTNAKRDLDNGAVDADLPLRDYLARYRYGDYFLHRYILPMASAIWSAAIDQVRTFNALGFLRFFANHGLLNLLNRPRWRVIRGGSRNYIPPLVRGFRDRVHTQSPVTGVRRGKDHVLVTAGGREQKFDHVVMACHSDQALAILRDRGDAEVRVLGAIPYRDNRVTLHTDHGLLPRRRRAWASWNYLIDGTENAGPVLTYNMNKLQGLDCAETICVSVNADRHVDADKILAQFVYAHPQFDNDSVAAQAAWNTVSGHNRTWFCGAYWGAGFHEDGVASAARVAAALGGDTP